jgi:hypothetical protein
MRHHVTSSIRQAIQNDPRTFVDSLVLSQAEGELHLVDIFVAKTTGGYPAQTQARVNLRQKS